MATTNPLDGHDEFLAGIYEILRRHEQLLVDLTADVEGLKANLTGHDREFFDKAKEKARSEAAFGLDRQARLYGEIIAKLRGT